MTTNLKIVKKCVTGIEVDDGCLKQLYEVCSRENLASVKFGLGSGTTVLVIKLSFFTHNSVFRTYLRVRRASVEDTSSSLK